MRTFNYKDIMKTAEHIRDFNAGIMADLAVKKDWDMLNRIRFSAMSEIEGLERLTVTIGYNSKSPIVIILHNIWKQLLNG